MKTIPHILNGRNIMVKVCAFLLALVASTAQAVEVFPDVDGKIAISDLIGNHIVVDGRTWGDWSFSATSGGGVTTPVASDIYFYPWAEWGTAYPGLNYNGVFDWNINTNPSPQTAEVTLNYSVTAASGNLQRAESLILGAATYPTSPSFSDITTKVYDSNPTLLATSQSRFGGSPVANDPIAAFTPLSTIDVETKLNSSGSSFQQASVDFIPEAEAGNTVDLDPGYRRRGGVLGGTETVNGVDVLFDRVTTAGTFSANLNVQDIEDVPQSLLDILPFEPGETLTTYDFDFDGEWETEDLGLLFVTKGFLLTIKYDENALGFDENLIRIWHEESPGEWVALAGNVDIENNLVTGYADSFSAFALGAEGGVPEPSTGFLLLFGLCATQVRRRGFLASVAALFLGNSKKISESRHSEWKYSTPQNGWRPHPDLARTKTSGSTSNIS